MSERPLWHSQRKKPSGRLGRKRRKMTLGTRVGVNKLSPLNPRSRVTAEQARLETLFRRVRGVTRSRVRRFVWVRNRHEREFPV